MASEEATLVRIRDLRYRYPGADHDVLRIPFLDVTGHGLIAVTGPSGAGKSTLIELLAGTLREDYTGSVQVLGKEWTDLRKDADRQQHLRRVGLIPQDYGLLTDRSVEDLLTQDLRDCGVPRGEHPQRITRALAEVGLHGVGGRLVASLSGGQRQRVAIARMLARDVELIIADEPTANLDPTLTRETVALFRRLAAHVPVLIITHDPAVAAACDRTIVLQAAVSELPEGALRPGPPERRSGRTSLVAGLVAAAVAVAAAAVYTVDRSRNVDGLRPAGRIALGAPTPTTAPVGAPPRTPASTVAPSGVPSDRSQPAPPAATTVRIWAPFTLTGLNPDIAVTGRGTGTCWGPSVADNSPDAYRCSVGNEIRDPCIVSPYGPPYPPLACARDPWSGVFLLSLSAPLPTFTGGNPSGPVPGWALELANGDRCVTMTGTNPVVGGIALNYGCGHGGAGILEKSRQPWTVEYLPEGSTTVSPVAVAVAWTG